MLFVSVEDFLTQADNLTRFSRDEEKALAVKMATGDSDARNALIRNYFPMVAAHIRRAPQQIRTLRTVYTYMDALEKAVDRFNFLQDNEPFTHHLGWVFRQCMTQCITNRP